MAERQLDHRHELESSVILGSLRSERRGQILGFILALAAVIGGVALVVRDKDVIGFATILLAVAGLVSVFVVGRRREMEERREKRSEFRSIADGAP